MHILYKERRHEGMYKVNRPGNHSMNTPWERPIYGNYVPEYAPEYIQNQTPGFKYDNVSAFMQDDPYSSPDLSEALRLIQDAINGESEDKAFYETLIGLAAPDDRTIINGIRNNEIKHHGMFKQLYYELTGQPAGPEKVVLPVQPTTYCKGLKKALLGEQSAVERYRTIMFALQDRRHINMLTEIITDELRHFGLYNYLYSKNRCSD
jgi:rubrerythrin